MVEDNSLSKPCGKVGWQLRPGDFISLCSFRALILGAQWLLRRSMGLMS